MGILDHALLLLACLAGLCAQASCSEVSLDPEVENRGYDRNASVGTVVETCGTYHSTGTPASDFFPLSPGNRWTYDLTSVGRLLSAGPDADSSSGVMVWEVVDALERCDTTFFSIARRFDGIYVQSKTPGYPTWGKPDTLTCESHFVIEQVHDSLSTEFSSDDGASLPCRQVFSVTSYRPHQRRVPWIEYPVARYPETLQDTLVVSSVGYGGEIHSLDSELARGQGIVYLRVDHRVAGPSSVAINELRLLHFDEAE